MKVEWKENLFSNDLFYEIDIANSLVEKSWFDDEESQGYWFSVDGHKVYFETVDELKFLLKGFVKTIDLQCEDISTKKIYVMKIDSPSYIIIAQFKINYDKYRRDTYVMEWDFYEEDWEEWKKRIKQKSQHKSAV